MKHHDSNIMIFGSTIGLANSVIESMPFNSASYLASIKHCIIWEETITLSSVVDYPCYFLPQKCNSNPILTAAKFQRAWMSIHWKILQMHWTFSLNCKPKSQNPTLCLNKLASQDRTLLTVVNKINDEVGLSL